ncbi:MAG: glycerophosphodiester phosphodiesterase family protein [Oscillospiraceae bacterium]
MKIILILLLVVLALFCMYLLLLAARHGKTTMAELKKFRYAHRGYHDKPQIPENSMAAFRRAVEHGFGAELDVHLLKDGTLAVMHDSSLLRTAGADVQIEDLTRGELAQYRLEGTAEPVPLLDEVLALFEDKTPLIIELKTARGNHLALSRAVCDRLGSYRGRFCIESFDPFALMDVKKLRPDFCRGQLSMDFEKEHAGLPFYKRLIVTNLLLNFLTRPDFIAYRFEDRRKLSPRLCQALWRAQPVSWTIRTKQDLLACEREGAIPIFERFDPET